MPAPTKLAFIDTETTGLNHLSRPTEIAVVLRETAVSMMQGKALAEPVEVRGRVVETEYLFHVEYDWFDLPEGTSNDALWISGWRHRMRRGCKNGEIYRREMAEQGVLTAAGAEWSIAPKVHGLLRGATIVGVGTHYDAEVLGRMFLRHDLSWHPWHYDIQDCKTLTRGYLRAELLAEEIPDDTDVWAKSDQLAEMLGVDPPTEEERHTALGDARWAARWWNKLS